MYFTQCTSHYTSHTALLPPELFGAIRGAHECVGGLIERRIVDRCERRGVACAELCVAEAHCAHTTASRAARDEQHVIRERTDAVDGDYLVVVAANAQRHVLRDESKHSHVKRCSGSSTRCASDKTSVSTYANTFD